MYHINYIIFYLKYATHSNLYEHEIPKRLIGDTIM